MTSLKFPGPLPGYGPEMEYSKKYGKCRKCSQIMTQLNPERELGENLTVLRMHCKFHLGNLFKCRVCGFLCHDEEKVLMNHLVVNHGVLDPGSGFYGSCSSMTKEKFRDELRKCIKEAFPEFTELVQRGGCPPPTGSQHAEAKKKSNTESLGPEFLVKKKAASTRVKDYIESIRFKSSIDDHVKTTERMSSGKPTGEFLKGEVTEADPKNKEVVEGPQTVSGNLGTKDAAVQKLEGSPPEINPKNA